MTQEKNEDNFVDRLFNGGSEVVQEEAQEAVETAPQEQETSQGETKKVETQSETLADEEQKQEEPQETWTKAAVLDERRKRQEMEKRLADMEAKLQASQSEQQAVKVPLQAPDPIDDPDAFNAYQDKRIFDMALKFDQRQLQEKYDDYDDTVEHFKKMAGDNPALVEAFQKQEFPATYAYNTAKADLNAKKYQDPNFLENLEKELEAKILKKLQGDVQTSKKPDATALPKLNGATSVVSNVEQRIELDDNDLSGFFKGQAY